MNGVKRYDPVNSDGTCGICAEDSDFGAYVEYSDYDTLAADNQRLEGEVARLTVSNANQTVRRFVGDDDQRQMDELVAAGIRADQQEIKRLREAVREFAGFFSSDDPKHWELHGLADGADYSSALTTNGEVTE